MDKTHADPLDTIQDPEKPCTVVLVNYFYITSDYIVSRLSHMFFYSADDCIVFLSSNILPNRNTAQACLQRRRSDIGGLNVHLH